MVLVYGLIFRIKRKLRYRYLCLCRFRSGYPSCHGNNPPAFAHSSTPRRHLYRHRKMPSESPAVVFHGNQHHAIFQTALHQNLAGTGMFQRIVQQLLNNAVQVCLLFLAQALELTIALQLNIGFAVLKAVAKVCQGYFKTKTA